MGKWAREHLKLSILGAETGGGEWGGVRCFRITKKLGAEKWSAESSREKKESGRAKHHVNQGLEAAKMKATANKAREDRQDASLSARVRACVHFAKAAVPYLMQMGKMQFLVSVP
jgi:hypothetical protein